MPTDQLPTGSACPFCGVVHSPGPVGIAGGPFAGVEFKVCPEIPDGCIYEDREYDSGPRGALHRLRLERETGAP